MSEHRSDSPPDFAPAVATSPAPTRRIFLGATAAAAFQGQALSTRLGIPILYGVDAASALVVAWLPGTEGGGIADVLFGAVKPTGKLPCSWPRDMAQIPINVGDPGYAPLFEYGFGLGW